jgi:hypothetical protein
MAARPRFHAAWLAALALTMAPGHASEATRYRDPQGIEMIRNRASAAPPATPTSVPPRSPVQPARFQIPPQEQQPRDRDRLTTLRQELAAELDALASHQRLIGSQDRDQAQRARVQQHRHQQNIRDLTAELERTSPPAKSPVK